MNLTRMTEIYRLGGRQELIDAVERFTISTKAEMLEDLNAIARSPAANMPRQRTSEGQADGEACSF